MKTLACFALTIGAATLLVECQSVQSSLTPSSSGTSALHRAQAPAESGKIVVALSNQSAVVAFPANGNGNIPPMSVLKGSKTELLYPGGLYVGADGELYVTVYSCSSSNCTHDAVNIYAPGAKGDEAPARQIVGDKTGLNYASAITLDSQGNIYVANGSSITVYAPSANGNDPPLRTITGSKTGLAIPEGLAVSSSGILFVANEHSNAITAYAAGASGNAAPIATIQGNATRLHGPWGVALDKRDHIYAVSGLGGRTHIGWNVVEFAANANGNQGPMREIKGPATLLHYPVSIAVDAKDKIYVSNARHDGRVLVFAADAHDDAAPIADISGSKTHMLGGGGALALSP